MWALPNAEICLVIAADGIRLEYCQVLDYSA